MRPEDVVEVGSAHLGVAKELEEFVSELFFICCQLVTLGGLAAGTSGFAAPAWEAVSIAPFARAFRCDRTV
jgi:hypothetical protein